MIGLTCRLMDGSRASSLRPSLHRLFSDFGWYLVFLHILHPFSSAFKWLAFTGRARGSGHGNDVVQVVIARRLVRALRVNDFTFKFQATSARGPRPTAILCSNTRKITDCPPCMIMERQFANSKELIDRQVARALIERNVEEKDLNGGLSLRAPFSPFEGSTTVVRLECSSVPIVLVSSLIPLP